MLKRKRIREKGIKISKYLKEFDVGDRVALLTDLSDGIAGTKFPKKYHGQVALIVGKQGKRAYRVRLLNGKIFILKANCLKLLVKTKSKVEIKAKSIIKAK